METTWERQKFQYLFQVQNKRENTQELPSSKPLGTTLTRK